MQEERPGLKRMVEIPGTGGNLLTKVWLRCPVWKMKHIYAYMTQDTERERDLTKKFGASDHQSTVFRCIQLYSGSMHATTKRRTARCCPITLTN